MSDTVGAEPQGAGRPHAVDPASSPSTRPRPDSAESSRPRPQYGEYATPEEQRARIRQPAPWQQEEQAVAAAPAAGIPASGAPVVPGSHTPLTAAVPGERPRQRPVDRIVTFALLAYGLVNVITSVPAFVDYSAYADTLLGMLGVDATLSDPGAGRGWGIAAALVLAVGWCATVVLSLWSVRRGRLTWWIPLTAGIVFTFAAGILMMVPLMSDPAVWQALVDSTRPAG